MFKTSKRLVAMLICLAMVLSMLPMSVFAAGTTIYVQPNSNWLKDGARFAAYFFGNGVKWVDCVDAGDGLYSVEVPEGFSKVIFCRMNPGNPSNSWNTKWNQTADLTVPTDNKVVYVVQENTWDKGNGQWIEKGGEVEEVPMDESWYLRGTLYSWETCDDGNRMTDNGDGTFSITLSLAAGSYQYKAGDAYWNKGIPEKNQSITLTEAADVTFTLDTNANTLTHDYVPSGEVTPDPEPTEDVYTVVGTLIGGWDPANTDGIMTGENGVYTLTVSDVEPGDYALKVVKNASWDGAYGGDGADGNYEFTVTTKCAVTITVDTNTGVLSVTGDGIGEKPVVPVDFYLVGYLNGANSGCDEDYATLNETYKFVDGKLVVTFTEDSYVFIKTSDNAKWYLSEAYDSDNSATLWNGKNYGEKMFAPANVELTYTLVENEDGSITLSYETAEPACEHEYEYACSKNCKLCGEETRPEAKHEYFYACDAYCMYCYELTNEEAAHSIKHVEAVEATCTATGNIEYWYCEYCNICWDNAEATGMPLNAMSVKTWKDHEYYYACDAYCKDCGELTNPDAAHTITHVEAVEATDCLSWDGNVEYWTCSDCGNCWLDEALTMQTNRFGVVTNGAHSYFTDCDTVCELCGEETRPEASHNVVHVEAVAPSCESEGNVEYWYCDVCGAAWLDEAQTQVTNLKSVILPATHSVKHVEAVAPTCETEGNIEYWYCTECLIAWTSEGQTEVTNLKNVILPVTHSIKHVEAKAATCTENGNVEYWYCTECGAAWTDELLREVTNLKSVITPAAHNYEGNVCTECGDVDIDVKYQTKGDAVRLITYVDDLANYTGVTFTITIGEETAEQTITKAYTSLIANGETKTTEDLFGIDGYLVLLTINSVPAGTEMTVSVTWNCIDGSTVTGDCRIISL